MRDAKWERSIEDWGVVGLEVRLPREGGLVSHGMVCAVESLKTDLDFVRLRCGVGVGHRGSVASSASLTLTLLLPRRR